MTAFEIGHNRVQAQLEAYEKPEPDADVQSDLDRLTESQKDAILGNG
jgi:hypothetical protein